MTTEKTGPDSQSPPHSNFCSNDFGLNDKCNIAMSDECGKIKGTESSAAPKIKSIIGLFVLKKYIIKSQHRVTYYSHLQ